MNGVVKSLQLVRLLDNVALWVWRTLMVSALVIVAATGVAHSNKLIALFASALVSAEVLRRQVSVLVWWYCNHYDGKALSENMNVDCEKQLAKVNKRHFTLLPVC